MKTIFDSVAQREIMDRLNKLTPQTQHAWGRMSVAQMLAHCAYGLQVPAGDFKIKPTWMRYIGRFFKSMATSDKPFSKNSPTAAEFLIKDERNFDVEKKNFLNSFQKISGGPQTVVCLEHAFFGPMTAEEWGKLMYKHTDHHFRQFGV